MTSRPGPMVAGHPGVEPGLHTPGTLQATRVGNPRFSWSGVDSRGWYGIRGRLVRVAGMADGRCGGAELLCRRNARGPVVVFAVLLTVGGLLSGLARPAPARAVGGFFSGAGGESVVLQATERFSDVGGAGPHRASVEILAARGILEGTECAAGRFCPDLPVQRWVMAVWLVRALDGTDPVRIDPPRFADVDEDAWWAVHVERLADLGITRGCAVEPARFCPDSPVTRAQMATFLDPRSRPRRYGPARELRHLLAAGSDTQQLGEDPTQPLVFGITGWGNSVIVSTMAFPTHTPHIVAQSARPHPAYSQLQTSSTYAQN